MVYRKGFTQRRARTRTGRSQRGTKGSCSSQASTCTEEPRRTRAGCKNDWIIMVLSFFIGLWKIAGEISYIYGSKYYCRLR